MQTRLLPWGALLLAAGPLAAHEDDPKLLDRQPPVEAPAFRRALAGPDGDDQALGLFDADGVELLAWLPLNQLDNASSGADCWGYVSPSGREYALMTTSSSTIFVEVTNPGNPVVIDTIDGPDSLWRDIKTYQQYAYAVSEGGSGIQIMDLSAIDSGNVTLVGTVNGAGGSATHNVAIDEVSGFLYRTGGDNNGLRIYSLANPANPTFVGAWNTRYVHDAQVVTYTSGPFAGRQIAFCCSGFNGGFSQTGLDILDVTNKSNIQVLANVFYTDPAYSHQGWLTEDRQYFYLGDELDEDGSKPTTTHVYDVSDIEAPQYLGAFTNGNGAVGHNMYTHQGVLYQANYRSGLRLFDLSDPANPVETGYFDSYPADDGSEFNGLWSVYPYLPSGTVLGSDLERGLFVWRVSSVGILYPAGVPELSDPLGSTFDVQFTGDFDGSTASLVYDAGSGPVTAPLTDLGGGLFQGSFPSLPCGSTVEWYVSVENTSGQLSTSPGSAPAQTWSTVVAEGETVAVADDMETDQGWTVGAPGDDATTGIWVRLNPIGTDAQPEDDHSPSGTRCWFTGQGSAGGSVGDADVDGGRTTLISPIYDASGMFDPTLSYWRWYSNSAGASPNADVFEVDISNNGGSSWISLEVVGPTGPETSGGWFQNSFRIADVIAPTSQMRLRFVASDEGSGSIVEAAIDDVELVDIVCADCNGNGVTDSQDIANGTSTDNNGNGIPDDCECESSNYCSATANSTGGPGSIVAAGSLVVADNSLTLVAFGLPAFTNGLFFYGADQVQVPFGNGNRCVGGQLYRLGITSTDLFGETSAAVDLSSPPQASGQVTAGSTWNFQYWYRDVAAGGAAFNLTDGVSVTFCP